MAIEGDAAPLVSLRNYFCAFHANGSNPRILSVPPWQRDYVWKARKNGQVAVLLADLKEFCASQDEDYLLGTIMLAPTAPGSNEYQIVDGQQRSITLTLLFAAALRYMNNQPHLFKDLSEVDESTRVNLRLCVSGQTEWFAPRLNMPYEQANKTLAMLWAWRQVPECEESDIFRENRNHWTPTQRNLMDVAEWLYRQIKSQQWLPDNILLPGLRKILEGGKVFEITLSDPRTAIAVFDRINNRGLRLGSGDLIKNRIFSGVESDEEFAKVSQSWLEMVAHLSACELPALKKPQFLLRSLALEDRGLASATDRHLRAASEKIEQHGKITFEELNSYWSSRLNPSGESSAQALNALDFANQLVDSSKWLNALSRSMTPAKANLEDLYVARYLKSVQHFPMMLTARRFSSIKSVRRLARQVHNRTLVYLLSDESPSQFESLVPSWTAALGKLNERASEEQLDEVYETYGQISNERLSLLIEQVPSWSYDKGSDRSKIRAVLATVSQMVNVAGGRKEIPLAEYFSTKKDSKSYSWDIDHVQPQSSDKLNPRIHQIGNLVLLKAKHNELKGKATPAEKRDVYQGSDLLLTQSLASITIEAERKTTKKIFARAGETLPVDTLDNWNEIAMSQRANLYAALLKYHLESLD